LNARLENTRRNNSSQVILKVSADHNPRSLRRHFFGRDTLETVTQILRDRQNQLHHAIKLITIMVDTKMEHNQETKIANEI